MKRSLLALVAALGLYPVSAAPQDKDDYDGLRKEMGERFTEWRASHARLDTEFASFLAHSSPSHASRKTSEFCLSNLKERADGVHDQLVKQLGAQRRYYDRHRGDALKAMNDTSSQIASQREFGKQKEEDLKNATAELAFLEQQRQQLIGNGEAGSNGAKLSDAVVKLEAAIRSRRTKLEYLPVTNDRARATIQSLEATRAEYRARELEANQSLELLDIQQEYWDSYYAMRRAQFVEYCPPPPMQGPLTAK